MYYVGASRRREFAAAVGIRFYLPEEAFGPGWDVLAGVPAASAAPAPAEQPAAGGPGSGLDANGAAGVEDAAEAAGGGGGGGAAAAAGAEEASPGGGSGQVGGSSVEGAKGAGATFKRYLSSSGRETP